MQRHFFYREEISMTWEVFIAFAGEDQIPGFVKTAREFALKDGITIQEVLDRSLERIRSTGAISVIDDVGKAIEAQLKGLYVRRR
jgi:hypothetical protein